MDDIINSANITPAPNRPCDYCTEANITQAHPEGTKNCSKCGRVFCPGHASKIDPQFCQSCHNDVVVKEETFTRVDEDYDEDTDTLNRTTKKCRQITFEGANWVWYSKAIREQTDEQLKTSIEYHRAIVYQIEDEITTRKVAKLQQAAKAGTKIKKTIETKTTKTVKQKQPLSLSDIADMAKKLNVPVSKLQAMLAGK